MDFLKSFKEVTCKVAETTKQKIKVVFTTATFKEVQVFTYEGSVSKHDLVNKGNFQMKIFNSETSQGIAEYKNWLKSKANTVLAIDSINSESLRLAQNSNRTWDKVSESAQLKKETFIIVLAVLAGKYGKEAMTKARADFPPEKYPALYSA